MDDTVAKDAKRLLLRYGAPISVVEKLADEDRIVIARQIIRTELSERGDKVRELLGERGFDIPKPKSRPKKARARK